MLRKFSDPMLKTQLHLVTLLAENPKKKNNQELARLQNVV